ncbi:MAG: hypothetical protein IT443_12060 [Phycisphaeraceae bacterium]|nr:hypothetical protein [Phycisphaeraceae bacterium]
MKRSLGFTLGLMLGFASLAFAQIVWPPGPYATDSPNASNGPAITKEFVELVALAHKDSARVGADLVAVHDATLEELKGIRQEVAALRLGLADLTAVQSSQASSMAIASTNLTTFTGQLVQIQEAQHQQLASFGLAVHEFTSWLHDAREWMDIWLKLRRGDMDGDGQITMTDLLLFQQLIRATESQP